MERFAFILDADTFRKGQKQLEKGSFSDDGSYLKSHQPVEIGEDGSIHIIH